MHIPIAIPLLFLCRLTAVLGVTPYELLLDEVAVSWQQNAHGASLLVGDATQHSQNHGRPVSAPTGSDQLLQVKCKGSKMIEPGFCSKATDGIWDNMCWHWKRLLSEGVVHRGRDVCCVAIPTACQDAPFTCSNASDCWTPSCDQEQWYIDHVEFPADQVLKASSIDALQCLFETAGRPCRKENAPDVFMDLRKLHNVLTEEVFNATFSTEVAAIVAELGQPSLIEDVASVKVLPWQHEHVERLQWYSEKASKPWDRVGVEHSFLVAVTSTGRYAVDKKDPFDVLVRVHDASRGRLYAEVEQHDLRPDLTLGQVVRQFPGGEPWNVLSNNCHQAAQAAFAWAAPKLRPPSVPNHKWEAVLTVANAVAPAAFKEHSVNAFRSMVEEAYGESN